MSAAFAPRSPKPVTTSAVVITPITCRKWLRIAPALFIRFGSSIVANSIEAVWQNIDVSVITVRRKRASCSLPRAAAPGVALCPSFGGNLMKAGGEHDFAAAGFPFGGGTGGGSGRDACLGASTGAHGRVSQQRQGKRRIHPGFHRLVGPWLHPGL